MSRGLPLIVITVLALGLSACAPEITRRPVEFTPVSSADSTGSVTVVNEVTVTPSVGYPRTITAGSQWRLIGRIGTGNVYRPMSGVFTVEGAHVHEAGLVVWEKRITGFYMLVEKAFVPLDPTVAVQLTGE